MENNFENYSLDELIAILCEQDLKISELKEIFSAFYFNYCKSKGQNPAKLRYVRIVNTSHYGETYGSYCKNTIDINTAYLVKLFSKNSSINRLKIISTLIHENRHFVQDEIINNISDIPVIINEGMGISICNKDFNENNMNVTLDGKFKIWKSENAILILRDDIEECVLNAYRINDSNNLLFLDDYFVGIEFKNLNQEEMKEIKNSKCLL